MKAYLGIRDTEVVYRERPAPEERRFGIDPGERNYTRLRLPHVPGDEPGAVAVATRGGRP
jgi:hypothetical protein